MTGVITKSSEATLWRRAVEVTSHRGVAEASPPAVGLLETLLPETLDVLEVCLDQPK